MKVYRYWHREERTATAADGHVYALTSWAGSPDSQSEARASALGRLDEWLGKLGRGEALGDYEYQTHEIREELVEEIRSPGGELIGALTRNRYGALVLNSASLFIADIDAAPPPGFVGRLMARFGRPVRDKAFHLAALRRFAQQHPSLSLLIYETHSGLRVFIVNKSFAPDSGRADELLATLESDPLYRTLCRAQQCYRARLTPKPWRCNTDRPPGRFPREASAVRHAFDKWLREYEGASRSFGVCRLLEKMGPGEVSAEAARLLSVHDAIALDTGNKPLA